MSAKTCFTAKVGRGQVANAPGHQILTMLDELEADYRKTMGSDEAAARQAAIDAATIAKAEATRKADLTNRSIKAQGATQARVKDYERIVTGLRSERATLGGNRAPLALRKEGQSTLYAALRAILVRDPHDVHGKYGNVHDGMMQLRQEATRRMAEAIRVLRPRFLGLVQSKAAELELLRAAYGDTSVSGDARAAYAGVNDAIEWLGDQYRDAGGALAKRKDWRVPNPVLSEGKVRRLTGQQFYDLVAAHADRGAMLDWATGKPMNDTQFDRVVEDVWRGFERGHFDEPPSGQAKGRKMLANSRDVSRVFVWKSPESWQAIASSIGEHDSVWQAVQDHISGLARDTALMRELGPNPQAWQRFAEDLIAREPSRLMLNAEQAGGDVAAVRHNNNMVDLGRKATKDLEDVYDEVTGANRIPISTKVAERASSVRGYLAATQLGSALISSLGDIATSAMTARFNRLPVADVMRGIAMIAGREGEIFAAQQGLVVDTLAHVAGQDDRIMGQVIRSSVGAKMGTAVIRASGLRLWTAKMRAGFALGWMTSLARHPDVPWRELHALRRDSFGRYGIGEAEYDLIRKTEAYEPRPNARLIRPADVRAGGTLAHRAAAEKWNRLINTEMEFATIEQDPIARAWMAGKVPPPGTVTGEFLRSPMMYRAFSASFVALHMTRAFSRGFDGTRLGHAALTLLYMSVMGILATQLKQVAGGRDPRPLDDWRTFAAGILQGGGLGVFGDLVNAAGTGRYGNSLAAQAAGPLVTAPDDIKNWLIPNISKLINGEETHFAGDALYIAARYTPGNNLWYSKLALQRVVLDQLALMIDGRARDRFQRLEREAAKNYGQDYYWRPGALTPERAPSIGLGQ
jgi:hypothetical protein